MNEDNICAFDDGEAALRLYLRTIGEIKPLTSRAETALAARTRKGSQQAREKFIKANLRLVVQIARNHEGLGLPLFDLISEGNLGLIKAVEKLDPAKAGQLAASASPWIKRSITRALATHHPKSIP